MSGVFLPPAGPRYRVISDNDYAGDPDGLFQLAHLLLSPSVEVRAVIGSHLALADPFVPTGDSAAPAVEAASEVLDLLGLADAIPVCRGSELPLADRTEPRRSAAAEAIVGEALRTDTDLPLFVVVGGGLTDLASAHLLEPAIADRLTAVWIGGPEYPESRVQPPPNALPIEYNLNIDLLAAQVLFESAVPLWQVPRNAYRECLASMSELLLRVRPHGQLGAHLYGALTELMQRISHAGLNMGETYILGDSPLVLLTALQTGFEADPASSAYVELPRPMITDDGQYAPNPAGHPVRVYAGLDVRTMLEDLYAKLELAAA